MYELLRKNSRNNIKEDPSVRYWYLICMFRYNSEGILIFRLFFHIHVEQYRLWTLSILYLTFRLLDGSENNKLHVCYKYRIWKLPPGLASTEKNILNRPHSDTNWNWEYTTRLHFSEVASTEKKYLSWRHQNWRRRSNSLIYIGFWTTYQSSIDQLFLTFSDPLVECLSSIF